MTLTASQYLYYRRLAGVNPVELTDTMIQESYDRAAALDDDTNIIKALTVVDMLEQLWGLFLKIIDVRGEVESESRNVIFDRIKQQLEYWQGQAGINGIGSMSTGTLDLRIDYTEADMLAESGGE